MILAFKSVAISDFHIVYDAQFNSNVVSLLFVNVPSNEQANQHMPCLHPVLDSYSAALVAATAVLIYLATQKHATACFDFRVLRLGLTV
jgi:hypothetical protein